MKILTTEPKLTQEFETNPFVNNELKQHLTKWIKVESRRDVEYEDELIYDKTGKVKGKRVSRIHKNYDSEPYVKLFTEHAKILTTLNKNAIRILIYIVNKMTMNHDKVNLKNKVVKQATGINSDRYYYEGINDLIQKQIIARTTDAKHIYYINPIIIWKGEREHLVEKFHEIKIKPKLKIA